MRKNRWTPCPRAKSKSQRAQESALVTAAEAAEINTILEFCGFDVDADDISISKDGL
jgi:hypothetical protein